MIAMAQVLILQDGRQSALVVCHAKMCAYIFYQLSELI